MKLTSKYNRYILPTIILLFLSSIIVSYFLIRNVLQNELDEIILRTQSRIENYVKAHDQIPEISSFNDQVISFEKLNGELKDSGFTSATQYIPEQHKSHLSRHLVFQTVIQQTRYKVVISQPLEGTKHLTILIVKIAIVTTFIILAILMLINRQVLAKVWEPFYESLKSFKSFRVNDTLAPVFSATNIDEFNLMNGHFIMAANNARLDFRNLKEFSENASHETQTPLAIIRSNLDVLIQQDDLTEKQSEAIQSVYSAVTKLSKLQQSLLLLTKIDNRQFVATTEVDLGNILHKKAVEFGEIWQNKEIECITSINTASVKINTDLLDILLNNLLNNATRHNYKNGLIHIKADKDEFTISNTGTDQPLDSERIFRRFYKGAVSSENTGLGLSIIKEICTASAINISYRFQNSMHLFYLNW